MRLQKPIVWQKELTKIGKVSSATVTASLKYGKPLNSNAMGLIIEHFNFSGDQVKRFFFNGKMPVQKKELDEDAILEIAQKVAMVAVERMRCL